MSYNAKYRMSFKDTLGAQCDIEFAFDSYAGEVIVLQLDESPVTVTFNGDEDNIFDTIHASQAEINIFQEVFNQDLYDDINNLTDKSCLVRINLSTGFQWYGWMIPDFSKKTFSNLTTVQTVQAKDLFSYLKGVPAVASDGKILYGKLTAEALLINAFSKGLSDTSTGINDRYELTSNMTITNQASELVGVNILKQLSIAAESFNSDQGRPPLCYDVINSVLHGLGLTCSLKGEKLIITDLVSEDLTVFKEIGIKQDEPANILINNDEVITKSRAAKELSAEFQYKRTTGILPDGFFSDWNGTTLNKWDWNNEGTMSQIGNGRSENPFGVKLSTTVTVTGGINFYSIAALRSTTYNPNILADSNYTIDFNVKYQDWKSWSISNLPNPQLQFGVLLVGASGKLYSLWQENGYTKDQSLWVEVEKDGSGNYVRDIDSFYSSGNDTNAQGLYTRRSISLDSTVAQQKLSYNIPSVPEDGSLYVYIQSAYLDSTSANLGTLPERADLIYYSVILSENLSVNANGVGGEKHYLTNFGDYSNIVDTETFELETGLNESVAGSIYAAVAFHIPTPNLNAGDYAVGDQINFVQNSISLVAWVLSNRMYFKRFSNVQLDVTFRSNIVIFQDLIKFMNGDTELLPGVYKQIKTVYDIKKCEQTVTAIQLKGERRLMGRDQAATETIDQYEFYYETN